MKKTLALILSAVLVLALFTGCGKKDSTEIHVGVLAPLTGANAENGKAFQVAMNMVAEEFNAKGGINGRSIVLDFEDDESDQTVAADLASKFAEDENVYAVLGCFTSGCSMAAAPICDEAGVTLLSPTSSNPALTTMSPYAFSIAGKSSEEAPYVAKYVAGKFCGAKTAAVFCINNDWGVSALEGFRSGAQEAGIEIVAEEMYVADETDYSAMITKAMAADPDLAILLDQTPATLLNQIRSSGWDVRCATYGPSTSTEVINLCGENAEGLLTTGPFFLDEGDPADKAFIEGFTKRAGFAPTVMAANAYDAATILFESMIACGDGLTREAVKDALIKTDGTYLTGPIKFDDDGSISRSYIICQVEDGSYALVADYDFVND